MTQIKKINDKLAKLHDSNFIMINDDLKNNNTLLSFLTDSSNKIEILLESVVSSRCNDWKYGNIVLDASIVYDYSRIKDLIIYIEDLTEIQIQKKDYLNLLEKILNKELFLIEINPSFGAYYLGIFKNLKIFEY